MSLRDFQRALLARGLDPGPIDGKWGQMTEGAAMAALSRWEMVFDTEIDPRAVDLIKEFEGFRADAYLDPAGIPTIGYGTTSRADVGIVPRLGMSISQEDAEKYLKRALVKFADQIRPAILPAPTPAEFGAFLSLAYNIGPEAFKRSSVLRHFNAGDKQASADAFRLWNRAGGRKLNGLVRRREAERSLFLSWLGR